MDYVVVADLNLGFPRVKLTRVCSQPAPNQI